MPARTLRRSVLVLLAALCVPVPIVAQPTGVIRLGETTVSLDGTWRFRPGDNPAWASPDLDDSQWATITVPGSWSRQGFGEHTGFAWYRLRVQVAVPAPPLALALGDVDSSYEAYANGVRIGHFGELGKRIYFERPTVVPIPAGALRADGRLVLAVRVWRDPLSNGSWGGLTGGPVQLGRQDTLAANLELRSLRRQSDRITTVVFSTLQWVLGLYLLTLFASQRDRREYLWYGLFLLAQPLNALLNVVSLETTFMTAHTAFLLNAMRLAASVPLVPQFVWTLFGRPVPRWLRAYQLSFVVFPVLVWFQPRLFDQPMPQLWLVPAFLLPLGVLAQEVARGNREARVLAVPLGLFLTGSSLQLLGHAGALWENWQEWVWFAVPGFGERISVTTLGLRLFTLVTALVLAQRFNRIRREREQWGAELDAARRIQERLLPTELPQLAGFALAGAWRPAREVGGDCYDAFAVDGRIALAIGDAVGKGLPAALLMTQVHAAVRACANTFPEPAALCKQVNEVLCAHLRRGQFITFCYGLLDADGTFVYCRAGHNPPLLVRADGSVEYLRTGGLALGASARARYASGRVQLGPADRLVLYTDGVTEAMDARQDEFGEERLATVVRGVVPVPERTPEQTVNAILAAVSAFAVLGLADDATLLVVENVVPVRSRAGVEASVAAPER